MATPSSSEASQARGEDGRHHHQHHQHHQHHHQHHGHNATVQHHQHQHHDHNATTHHQHQHHQHQHHDHNATVPENPLTRSQQQLQEHGFTNLWSITHHHHIHHHHYHRDEDDLTQSHPADHRSQLTEAHPDDTETDASTEDSIIIELADVAYDQVDPDEFDIIELDLDQLGIVEEGRLEAEEGAQAAPTHSQSRIRIMEDMSPMQPADRKRRRFSKAFVGLPRKIRVLKPKVVHRILSVLEANTLRPVPKSVTIIAILTALNSVLQFIADSIIEVLAASGVGYHHSGHFRLAFLFLTILSALLGLFTLVGIRARELDMTRESLILGFVVESGLIAADMFFILKEEEHPFPAADYRIPFIILTAINIAGILYMFISLHLLDGLNKVLARYWKRGVNKVAASLSHHNIKASVSIDMSNIPKSGSKPRFAKDSISHSESSGSDIVVEVAEEKQ